MTLDDLKNINFNDVSSWPIPVKIVGVGFVCIAILVAGYFAVIQGMLDEYDVATRQEQGLFETYLNKRHWQ